MSTGVPVSISTGMLRLSLAPTNPVVTGVVLLNSPGAANQTFTIDVVAPPNCGWEVQGGSSFTVQCNAGQTTASFTFTLNATTNPAEKAIPWAMLVILRREGGPAGSPVVTTVLRIEP